MARPKGSKNQKDVEVKEIVPEIKEEVKEIITSEESDEIKKRSEEEFNRGEIARLDGEKADKDMLLKTAKELKSHIIDVRKILDGLNHEVENKYKALTHLDVEIKAQNYNLSRQNESFEKANQESVRILSIKQKEVEEADGLYKKLLSDVNEIKRTLSIQLTAIANERNSHLIEQNKMVTHVSQVEGEAAKNRADISEREELLSKATEAFELEKASLKPELTRISEIKNENLMLLQKLDAEKAQFERQKSLLDAHKQKLDADARLLEQQVTTKLQSLQNQEAKYRKWEQDLNDQTLELRARESEVAKAMKRYQLNQVVESNKE